MLDPISSAADKTDAALQFQLATDDATRIVRQQANAQARPYYDAARAGGQALSPDLAQLMDNPAVQEAMTAARKDYSTSSTARPRRIPPDFDLWNMTKQQLDTAYKTAKDAGNNSTTAACHRQRAPAGSL